MRTCCLWGLFLAITLAVHPAGAAGPVVVFPNDPTAVRLRLEVQFELDSPESVADAFLDKWFDFFDRDGNALLSDQEVRRVLPLPLADQRQAVLEVKDFDADGDGQGSRTEIKACYQRAGFTPIVTVVEATRADATHVSDNLFRMLDADANGVLNVTELRRAALLLQRLDEDEDESLTAAELLSGPLEDRPTAVVAVNPLVVETMSENGAPHSVMSIHFGSKSRAATIAVGSDATSLIEKISEEEETPLRLRIGQHFCAAIVEPTVKPRLMRDVRSFYLAQFRTTFGAKAAVSKEQLAQDATLKLAVELFNVAERDGDGKLTADELNAFLTLIEQGVASQTKITLRSHGRDLFRHLDNDHDERLVLSELNAAVKVLVNDAVDSVITQDELPMQFQLNVERGTPQATFGTVPIPHHSARANTPSSAKDVAGPRWFKALDRNADGVISPQEFPGKPERFLQFDSDKDGLINAGESMPDGSKSPNAGP